MLPRQSCSNEWRTVERLRVLPALPAGGTFPEHSDACPGGVWEQNNRLSKELLRTLHSAQSETRFVPFPSHHWRVWGYCFSKLQCNH